jgi:hypothetical protein
LEKTTFQNDQTRLHLTDRLKKLSKYEGIDLERMMDDGAEQEVKIQKLQKELSKKNIDILKSKVKMHPKKNKTNWQHQPDVKAKMVDLMAQNIHLKELLKENGIQIPGIFHFNKIYLILKRKLILRFLNR